MKKGDIFICAKRGRDDLYEVTIMDVSKKEDYIKILSQRGQVHIWGKKEVYIGWTSVLEFETVMTILGECR
jgi:hypothetical protein